jgi:hypothetical protein
MDRDELRQCEEYADDYTIKLYEREDCRYYAIVVYETDDDSKVIYTCKSQPDAGKAKALAVDAVKKHRRIK